VKEPRFQAGDLVDIVLRRVVVREVHDRGTLSIIHSDVELHSFDPGAADVEVIRVGHLPPCTACDGGDRRCHSCGGTGEAFR
jgi:hypothetical protein